MFRYSFVILCAVLVLSNVAFTNAGKYGGGGGRSGGFSGRGGGRGGGVHYPPSSGYSGTGSGRGGSVHYPPSSGYSGTGSGRGGGVHYPPSNGASGTGSGHGGVHYPPSPGMSGNQGGKYPPSHGVSGNNNYQGGRVNAGSTSTHVHHHYHYSPPQQINYGAHTYPVYRGSPPTYVYQYKNSGSKYGTLLAGLALFNLGALAGVAGSQIHSHQKYVPREGEICLFGVKKDNGDYEQTKIDCSLITSFIYQQQAETGKLPTNATSHTVTTTTTNVTMVNTTNTAPDAPQVTQPEGAPNITYTMLSNGTLVPVNVTTNVTTDTPAAPAGGSSSVVYTTTTTNTTVVDALEAKGAPVQVTPGMTCYVIRKIGNTSLMKKTVPCGVLQTYADKSLKRNSAVRTVPAFTILAVICTVFLVY